MKQLLRVSLAGIVLALAGCASLGPRPEAPTVTLADITPVTLGLTEQTLRFDLDVHNPNPFDLPVKGVRFTATVSDVEVASGYSDQTVTVPAGGNATLGVDVDMALAKVLQNFQSQFTGKGLNLDYSLHGTVDLANSPTRFPFDVEGNLLRSGG